MHDYQVNWHHRLLCGYLDKFAAGEITRLMVFMPPRHGKSELCSRRLPAYLFGRNPDLRILACSHTGSLAADMNRDVQRIIDDEPYRRLFPRSQLRGSERTVGVKAQRTMDAFEIVDHAGIYRSAGVGSAIVGRGFDKGIIDDPHAGREAADSPVQREAVWKWYTGDFLTRRSEKAGILLIVTRWHPEDLAGLLLRQAESDPRADQWEVLRLPAVCELDGKHPQDPRKEGEALWPARYSLAELAKTKAANPYDWWSQYQQKPRAPGSTEWPESYFDWPGFWFDYWPVDIATEIKVMALDPSKGKESKTGDYQAVIKYARDKDGCEYVEADMGKRPVTAMQAPDGTELSEGMCETLIDNAREFKPEGIGIEGNQFQELLVIPLKDVAKRRGYDREFRPYLINNQVNKLVRIRRLGMPLSERRMRFKRNSPGTRLLVEQLKQFPTADHDDGPDALEMARRLAIELVNGRP